MKHVQHWVNIVRRRAAEVHGAYRRAPVVKPIMGAKFSIRITSQLYIAWKKFIPESPLHRNIAWKKFGADAGAVMHK